MPGEAGRRQDPDEFTNTPIINNIDTRNYNNLKFTRVQYYGYVNLQMELNADRSDQIVSVVCDSNAAS